MLKKGDFILVAIVLVAVAAGFSGLKLYNAGSAGVHKIAVIRQNDKVIKKIDLDTVETPQRVEISGSYREVILVEKGRIRFEEANCPDLICVKTGWLTKRGDVAVCLPNRTIIKIEGQSEEIDGGTY